MHYSPFTNKRLLGIKQAHAEFVCSNGCNNSQQCWDLQCTVGRKKPIRLCKPRVMCVRGPNNIGRAVQKHTLLRYVSVITEKQKSWKVWPVSNFAQQLPTGCANRRNIQHPTSNNVGSCWPTMLRPFVRGFRALKRAPPPPTLFSRNCFKPCVHTLGDTAVFSVVT